MNAQPGMKEAMATRTPRPCFRRGVGPLGRAPSRLPGEDDELSLGAVLFHEAMGLDDLVQPEYSPDLHAVVPSFYLVDELLKRSPHEILGNANVGCQADRSRNGLHRRKALEVLLVADHPRHADDPVTLGGLEGVEQGCRPDELQNVVDSTRKHVSNLLGDAAGVNEDSIRAVVTEELFTFRATTRRYDSDTVFPRQDRRCQSHRGCATANEEGLAGSHLERGVEGAPRGLDHLGKRPECWPVKRRFERLHLSSRNAGVLGVGTVELSTHASHSRGHGLARRQLGAPSSHDLPTASIPRIRGRVTEGEWPCRVNSSERLRPKARTLISTQPGFDCGTGRSWTVKTSGGPGRSMTTALMLCAHDRLSAVDAVFCDMDWLPILGLTTW